MGAHSILEKPLFSKRHFSRKATFLEKTLFAKSDFLATGGAQRARKVTFPEKPLFSKSNFLRKGTFLATLARAASAKSHFCRKATFLEKTLFTKSDFARDVGACSIREKPLL